MLFLLSDLGAFLEWVISVKSPIFLLLGVIQIVEVILNGMVLMCIVASYFVPGGFSASFASGGFGNNYYSPFEGTRAGAGSAAGPAVHNPPGTPDIWRRGCFSGSPVSSPWVFYSKGKSYINCQEVAPPGGHLQPPGGSGLLRGHRHLPPHSLADQCHRHLQNKRGSMPARVSPGWTASWQAPMEQLPPLLVFWWWCMVPAWCWPCGATENRSSTRTARNSREITMMHQNTCGLEYSEIHWNLKSTHLVSLKRWVH